jgi:serine/threonine protein kinase
LLSTPDFKSVDLQRSTIAGEGKFGIVWKVYETYSDQSYALKICAAQPTAWKQYQTEVLISKLLRTTYKDPIYKPVEACLPVIYSEFLNDKFFYLFMEYIDAVELSKYYISDIRAPAFKLYDTITLLKIQHVETIVAQLLATVQFLHSKGIIHRDIKPDNILLIPPENIRNNAHVDKDNKKRFHVTIPIVKLIDFGLSKHVDMTHSMNPSLTQSQYRQQGPLFQSNVGTPLFLSPESFTGSHNARSGVAVDLYSIGVLALYLAYGYCPGYSTPATIPDQTALAKIRRDFTFQDYEREYNEVYRLHVDYQRHRQHQAQYSSTHQAQYVYQAECKASPEFKEALGLLFELKPEKRKGVYETKWFNTIYPKVQQNLIKYQSLLEKIDETTVDNVMSQSQAIINSPSRDIITSSSNVGYAGNQLQQVYPQQQQHQQQQNVQNNTQINQITNKTQNIPQIPEHIHPPPPPAQQPQQYQIHNEAHPESDDSDNECGLGATTKQPSGTPLTEKERKIQMAVKLPLPSLLNSIITKGRNGNFDETDVDLINQIHRVQQPDRMNNPTAVGPQKATPQYETVIEGDEENEEEEEEVEEEEKNRDENEDEYQFDDDIIPCNPFASKTGIEVKSERLSLKSLQNQIFLTASSPIQTIREYSYHYPYFASFKAHYKPMLLQALALNNVNRVLVLSYLWYDSSKANISPSFRHTREEEILLNSQQQLPRLNLCTCVQYLNQSMKMQFSKFKNAHNLAPNTSQSTPTTTNPISPLKNPSQTSITSTPTSSTNPNTPSQAKTKQNNQNNQNIAHNQIFTVYESMLFAQKSPNMNTGNSSSHSEVKYSTVQSKDMTIIDLHAFDSFSAQLPRQQCRILFIISLLSFSVHYTQSVLVFLKDLVIVYRKKFLAQFNKDKLEQHGNNGSQNSPNNSQTDQTDQTDHNSYIPSPNGGDISHPVLEMTEFQRILASTYSRCIKWIETQIDVIDASLQSSLSLLQTSINTYIIVLEHSFIANLLSQSGVSPVFQKTKIFSAQNSIAQNQFELSQHLNPSNVYFSYGDLVYRLAKRYVSCMDCPNCTVVGLAGKNGGESGQNGQNIEQNINKINQNLQTQNNQNLYNKQFVPSHLVEMYHLIRVPTFSVIKTFIPPRLAQVSKGGNDLLKIPSKNTESIDETHPITQNDIRQLPKQPSTSTTAHIPLPLPPRPRQLSQLTQNASHGVHNVGSNISVDLEKKNSANNTIMLGNQVPTIYFEFYSRELHAKKLAELEKNDKNSKLWTFAKHDFTNDPFSSLFSLFPSSGNIVIESKEQSNNNNDNNNETKENNEKKQKKLTLPQFIMPIPNQSQTPHTITLNTDDDNTNNGNNTPKNVTFGSNQATSSTASSTSSYSSLDSSGSLFDSNLHFSLPQYTNLSISSTKFINDPKKNQNKPHKQHNGSDNTKNNSNNNNNNNYDDNNDSDLNDNYYQDDLLPFFNLKPIINKNIQITSFGKLRTSDSIDIVLSSSLRKLVAIFTSISKHHKLLFDTKVFTIGDISTFNSFLREIKESNGRLLNNGINNGQNTIDTNFQNPTSTILREETNLRYVEMQKRLTDQNTIIVLQNNLYQWVKYIFYVINLFDIKIGGSSGSSNSASSSSK